MGTKTISSYKDGLKDLTAQLGEMLPQQILNHFDTEAKQLAADYSLPLKLRVGDKAPMFSLTNAVGETISLTGMLKKGKVVLVFYRGSWCPYCNLQLKKYQEALHDINESGANLVAISPQTPDESLSLAEKNELKFEVLSDNGNVVTRQFTTVFKFSDESIDAMNQLGIDFDAHYADDSREIPVPAVFVIDQDASIIFAKSEGGDYRKRVEPVEVLNALKK